MGALEAFRVPEVFFLAPLNLLRGCNKVSQGFEVLSVLVFLGICEGRV